ncbi:DUF1196 domain-containing protein, partial [Vibrio cholerae]|nr:DUF1196 domain-containing protein [Vibrio cholerae]
LTVPLEAFVSCVFEHCHL